MAALGEAIYEDYLYKFTGRSRSIFGKGNPWKQKYFILKRLGNRPVLEYFNKKPKTRTTIPRGKVDLSPSYRVEKVTNMNNRAYVFQITTPACTLRLSADEQRSMDVFVFFLQIQSRIKEQIRDDFFHVKPENSEAQRRIGAKSVQSLLHVSPYGLTLSLQSSRAVLAQWPLKSIRFYESSGGGEFTLEAGRVAPMGDGLYVFHTQSGDDDRLFSIIDQNVMSTLQQVQPDRRGNTGEIEDYVLEAERLLALTTVAACTMDNPDIPAIVRNNWNTEPTALQGSTRPKQVVHTRLTTSASTTSISSQNSNTGPTLPPRTALDGSMRNSPQVTRSLANLQNSPTNSGLRNSPLMDSRRGPVPAQSNMANRPPCPPPSNSIPLKIPQRSQTVDQPGLDQYMRMNSSVSRTHSSPTSPFTPPSADWQPPPSFKDVMRQGSRLPILEKEMYTPESYLNPSPGALATSTPVHSPNRASIRDQYLTPSSFSEENNNSIMADMHKFKTKNNGKHIDNKHLVNSQVSPNQNLLDNKRRRRLRSASCEDFSDYLRTVVYDPALMSKSLNDLLSDETDIGDISPEPFPRLQTFSGRLEFEGNHSLDNYYNIEGLRGKVYDNPGLTVGELRKRFTKRSRSRIRRSVSNPNFIGRLSVEKLHSVRVSTGVSFPQKSHNRSFTSLLPDALKKRLSKDSAQQLSPGTLSGSSVSPKSGSRASSRGSSRAGSHSGSCSNSPGNTLQRGQGSSHTEEIVATTTIKGINVTKRSRSFRRQKARDETSGASGAENHYIEQGSNPIPNKPADSAGGTDRFVGNRVKTTDNSKNNEQGFKTTDNSKNNEQGFKTTDNTENDTEEGFDGSGYIGFESVTLEKSELKSKAKGDHSQSFVTKFTKGRNPEVLEDLQKERLPNSMLMSKAAPPKLAPKPAARPSPAVPIRKNSKS